VCSDKEKYLIYHRLMKGKENKMEISLRKHGGE
jgi:hypothetical protein